MPKCSVKKCKSNSLFVLKKDGISYFGFPKNEIVREKWRKIVANERGEEFYKPNRSSVVCSRHFTENEMYFTKKGYRKIKKEVLPHVDIYSSRMQSNDRAQLAIDITPDTLTNIYVYAKETTTTSLNAPNYGGEKLLALKQEIEEEAEIIQSQDERAPEITVLNQCPSPTAFRLYSILDSPKTSQYKKTLRLCEKTIQLKNKQIQNLKKKNKRLVKRNIILKEMVASLKKKRPVDKSQRVKRVKKNVNESNKDNSLY